MWAARFDIKCLHYLKSVSLCTFVNILNLSKHIEKNTETNILELERMLHLTLLCYSISHCALFLCVTTLQIGTKIKGVISTLNSICMSYIGVYLK